MLFLWAGLALANPPRLTWEHNCLDIDGNPETLAGWAATVTDGADAVISEQSLPDAECALREWTLEPFDLAGGREFEIELIAIDEAGNESDPAVVSWTATDTIAPEKPNVINLDFTCPPGYTCNVRIDGVSQ